MTAWWCLVIGPSIATALYLAWEYRHAILVDADEQPIDLRTLPIRDAAVLVQVDELMPELAEFLGGEGRRS